MRILLLAYVFPPHPEVGALRAANLLAAFRAAGHQVTLVTEPLPGQVPLIPPGPGPEPRVITVPPGLPYATRLSRWLTRSRRTAPPPGAAGTPSAATALAIPAPPGPLRRLLLAALGLPEEANYSIAAFARAGREALQGGGVDLLYSSAPPFSIHLSALRLRRASRVPWAAEFRDPWTHPATSRLAALHPLTRPLDRWLERRVVRHADALVMNTGAAAEHVARLLPAGGTDRILVARNGIPDWGDPPPRAAGGKPFRIVHTGSLYMGRDPATFLEAVGRLVRQRGLTPAALRIEMIGDARRYQATSVADLVARAGLGGFVEFEDWLPHAEVRRRLYRADALLLLAQGQPLQVPNKLYEYLAAGRPILAYVDQDGESARILRDLPGNYLWDHPPAGAVEAVLGALLDGAGPPASASAERLAALSTRAELGRLVRELERRFAPAQIPA